MGEKCFDKVWPRIRLPRNSRDILHAANLRHGKDGFTSPPKEGVLRIFSPLKIPKFAGLNPRTWVPKANTLTPRPPKPLFVVYLTQFRKIKGCKIRGGQGWNLTVVLNRRGPPLWSSGQSFWLQIQRSRVRFPALPDFLSSSGSGTGSTQPREIN